MMTLILYHNSSPSENEERTPVNIKNFSTKIILKFENKKLLKINFILSHARCQPDSRLLGASTSFNRSLLCCVNLPILKNIDSLTSSRRCCAVCIVKSIILHCKSSELTTASLFEKVRTHCSALEQV